MKITRKDLPAKAADVPLSDVKVGTVFEGRLHGSHVTGNGPFLRCQSGAVCLATGQHSKTVYETETIDFSGIFGAFVGGGLTGYRSPGHGFTIPVRVANYVVLEAEVVVLGPLK